MNFSSLKLNKIEKLPAGTGVYCFSNGKEILYLGKAANIKERVKNHFQQPNYRDSLFINKVRKVGYLITDSEIEALLLEAKLIKKYQPKYNVAWKDDKNYFYVGITKENYPRIFITHQIQNSKGKSQNYNPKSKIIYVGPFVDGTALKQTLKVLRKVFPYRSCNKIPKHPCLWHQLARCPAPCLLKTNLGQQIVQDRISDVKIECQRNMKNLIKILQGEKGQTLKDLKKEMKAASDSQNYEKAARIRDKITSLEKVISHARVFEPPLEIVEDSPKQIHKRAEAYDVSNIQGKEATGSMVTFRNGKPDKNFYRRFKIKIAGKPNDVAMIKEILARRLKHKEWPYPDLILIDGGKAQLNAAKSILFRRRLNKIKVAALAKKKNELFLENEKKPVLLKTMPREIFNLILQLRDEAHRFAVSYHRKLRKRRLIPK